MYHALPWTLSPEAGLRRVRVVVMKLQVRYISCQMLGACRCQDYRAVSYLESVPTEARRGRPLSQTFLLQQVPRSRSPPIECHCAPSATVRTRVKLGPGHYTQALRLREARLYHLVDDPASGDSLRSADRA